MFKFISNFFQSKPFLKTIYHEDWIFDENGENGQVVISKKEHGKRRPCVQFIVNDKIMRYLNYSLDGGEVTIKRGMPKWQGTPFSVTVKIS